MFPPSQLGMRCQRDASSAHREEGVWIGAGRSQLLISTLVQAQPQPAPAPAPAPARTAPAPPVGSTAMEEDQELDPELAEALRMSMQQDDGGDAAVPTGAPAGDVRPAT